MYGTRVHMLHGACDISYFRQIITVSQFTFMLEVDDLFAALFLCDLLSHTYENLILFL